MCAATREDECTPHRPGEQYNRKAPKKKKKCKPDFGQPRLLHLPDFILYYYLFIYLFIYFWPSES